MVTAREKKSLIIILGFITILLLVPCAQAQQSIDVISCGDEKITTVVSNQELTIRGIEGKGITIDNLPNKVYDNLTYHGGGVLRLEKDKMSGKLY